MLRGSPSARSSSVSENQRMFWAARDLSSHSKIKPTPDGKLGAEYQ